MGQQQQLDSNGSPGFMHRAIVDGQVILNTLNRVGRAQSQPSHRPQEGRTYGMLSAPEARDVANLRREQARFGKVIKRLDKENRWLAAPVLASGAAILGFGVGSIAGGLAPRISATSSRVLGPGPKSAETPQARQPLTQQAKALIRDQARAKYARANGISARDMQAEVHHSDPLEWSHVKPKADPNRLANLWALRSEAHDIATREWAAFSRALKGRLPTQTELMRAKIRIDEMVAPYVRRAGLPRSSNPPRTGGPI